MSQLETTHIPLQRAAFFDIDGTLTNDRTWKGILGYFQQHKLRRGTHWTFLSIHLPQYMMRKAGLLSETTFRRRWAANLSWYTRGDKVAQAEVVWNWAVEQFMSQHWRADTRAILEGHRQAGDIVVLVSSAPQPLVERVAREVGAAHAIGTGFEIKDGRYTGRSLPPVCIDVHKVSLPRQHLQKKGIAVDLKTSFAYADSISDLPLLEMVGSPAAVYPDEKLAALARQRGWRIISD